jgi:hypothetical protein
VNTELIREESRKIIRHPVGKVRITWTDSLIDVSIEVTPNEQNRVSYNWQVADIVEDTPRKWFCANDSEVTTNNNFYAMPSNTKEARQYQVGFRGSSVSGSGGAFSAPYPTIQLNFAKRPVYGYRLVGDTAMGEYAVDFKVKVYRRLGGSFFLSEEQLITGNAQMKYDGVFDNQNMDIERMEFEILRWSRAGTFAKIAESYSSIIREYTNDDILSMSILEETESSDGTIPVGNISCNEMDLTLQNLDNSFFPFNIDSEYYTLMKKNRKIESFLGFVMPDGTEEYTPKGLYWSGDWSIPEQGTGASTSARDRMDLLRRLTYNGFTNPDDPETKAESTYWTNITVKQLAENIFDFLLDYMPDLFWDIDDELNNIVIPLAFFKRQSFFEIVKKIAQIGLAYAFMDSPTEEESAGNPLCKDVLRIKSLAALFDQDIDPEDDPIRITQDDYITKEQPARSEELANYVKAEYATYQIDPEKNIPVEVEGSRVEYIAQDTDSIREFGRLEYEYKSNELIQTEDHAFLIASSLVLIFKKIPIYADIQAFGDPTLRIADFVEVPEYQKNGIDKRGLYAIRKINSEYNGFFRQNIECRRIADTSFIRWDIFNPNFSRVAVIYGDNLEFIFPYSGLWTIGLIIKDGRYRSKRFVDVHVSDKEISWQWDTQGETYLGKEFERVYNTSGALTLTIGDTKGRTATDSVEITVE